MKRLFYISSLLICIFLFSLQSEARTIVVRSNNHSNYGHYHHSKQHHSHYKKYKHYIPSTYNISRNWNYHTQVYYPSTSQVYCNRCGHYHVIVNNHSCPQPRSIQYYYSEY